MESQVLNNLRSCVTSGEILPNGHVVDLVAPSPDGDLEIIVYDGEKTIVVPQFELGGVIYHPPKLHPTTRHAVRFPQAVADYENAAVLLVKLIGLCKGYFGASEMFATIIAVWVITTWLPELFASPPILCVAAPSLADAMRLFRLLSAVCRRALAVADLTLRLPTELHPTLLVIECALSKKVRASWRTCNFHGVYVPSASGGLREIVCSKAIYSASEDAIAGWGEDALRVLVLPAQDRPVLGEGDLQAIADEFQPQLELFRLRRLHCPSGSTKAACPDGLAGSGLGRELFSVLAGEPEIPKLLLPFAEQQRQMIKARRMLDPLCVLVEVLWGPAHQKDSISTTEIQGRVNAVLQTRGETAEFSVKEIGWKLSALDLRRHRTANGMVLKFSLENRRRIHEFARRFGLTVSKMNGCSECVPVQVIEQ